LTTLSARKRKLEKSGAEIKKKVKAPKETQGIGGRYQKN